MRSNRSFCFRLWASEISGTNRVERADKKEAGKKRTGMAMPLSIPNWDKEVSLELVYWVKRSGTRRFSMVRSRELRHPPAGMGAEMESIFPKTE